MTAIDQTRPISCTKSLQPGGRPHMGSGLAAARRPGMTRYLVVFLQSPTGGEGRRGAAEPNPEQGEGERQFGRISCHCGFPYAVAMQRLNLASSEQPAGLAAGMPGLEGPYGTSGPAAGATVTAPRLLWLGVQSGGLYSAPGD